MDEAVEDESAELALFPPVGSQLATIAGKVESHDILTEAHRYKYLSPKRQHLLLQESSRGLLLATAKI